MISLSDYNRVTNDLVSTIAWYMVMFMFLPYIVAVVMCKAIDKWGGKPSAATV